MFDEDVELLRKMREDKDSRDVHDLEEYYRKSYLSNMFIVFANMIFAMFNGLKIGYDGLDENSIPVISINLILWFFHIFFYVVGLIGASNDSFKIGEYGRTRRF